MPETQYRTKGNGANLRDEPSVTAKIVTTLSPGSVLYLDAQRRTDTDDTGHTWLPVVMVHGWVRSDTVEELTGQ